MINAIRDLMVGVFEHLYINSKMDLDIIIKYMERILKGPILKEF